MATTNDILDQTKNLGRNVLTEIEAKQVIRAAGVNVTDTRSAASPQEAAAVSRQIGFPVVLKIVSPDIIHKSDCGGVKTGLQDAKQVKKAYAAIMASVKEKMPVAKIDGVSVQNMAPPGTEVIIGTFQDPQFGPVIMFGLGGIFVEVLKDVSFRLVPISRHDAEEMVAEIKGRALLQGYRGREPADINSIIEILLKISALVEKTPRIKELDLNPVFVSKDATVAADARIILED